MPACSELPQHRPGLTVIANALRLGEQLAGCALSDSAVTSSDAISSRHRRMAERDEGHQPWSRWGSYLSDRQWGTVREDYSADGNAWSSFPHEHARMRCYRWEKTVCSASAMRRGCSVLVSPFGMAVIPS